MSDDSYNGIIATQQSAGHPMTSLSDLARKAGFTASVGKTDKNGVYKPDVNAIGRDVPIEWLERLLALHVQELCAGVEPVAYRLDYHPEFGVGAPRFFGADDSGRMERCINNYGAKVNPLYPASAVAALQERVAELEDLYSSMTKIFAAVCESNKIDPEDYTAYCVAVEALRSKK